jgi:hypothetical protein
MEHPILTTIKRAGFTPLGWFAPETSDDVPGGAKFVVLIGNAGTDMFRRFMQMRGSPEASIDQWTMEVVGTLANDLSAEVVYPFQQPPLPFLRWAKRGGAGHQSPLGLNIHNTYGLWHAYRAALLFPVAFDLPTPSPGLHPCESCVDKPCLAACPVSAFSPSGYDVAACADHVQATVGAACAGGGCLARHACPIGLAYAYHPVQAQFFMRAFIEARRKVAGAAA